MELLRVLFASLLLLSVSAVSDGNLLACNVDMSIGKGTSVMRWAAAPVASDMYEIRTAPGISTYTYGTLTPVTIVVKEIDYLYIGLLLVALSTGSNSTANGKWHIKDGDDFFLPATCKFDAVVHSSAELKPFEQTFYWEAGAGGQGSVTFRALIKQGEQNHGSFYKPANLVLTEKLGTPPARGVWKSARGHSCNDACGQQGMKCDQTGTLNLNTATKLQSAVQNFYPCREPLLKYCGPPATGAGAQCFYHKCSASETFDASTTCTRRSSDPKMDQQFCVCTSGAALKDEVAPVANATSALGYRLAAPVQIHEEITINSIEVRDGVVTVDVTGPQDRWFAIGWNASFMQGAYATVISLNNPLRVPQNFESISDKGVVDAFQGWFDVKCQQACLDYCRTVGNPPYFSCALSNTTIQKSLPYNVSDPATYAAMSTSRVPCRGGKIAPFQAMSVSEWTLASPTTAPRTAARQPNTITVKRTVVEGGQFRIEFSRPVLGNITFPVAKTVPIIYSVGVHQYFGKTITSGNPFSKHSFFGIPPALQFVPIYPVCDSMAPTKVGETRAPTRAPTIFGEGEGLSAGVSTLPSMLLLGSLAALGTKNWFVGLLLAVLVKPASAHNWVNTPSRAYIAAVNIPCVARVDPAPHLQVIPGQEFQMEWSTGHGDTGTLWTYWIFLKEENYDMLYKLTDAHMEDYLAKAPAASILTGDKWTRRHLAPYNNYLGCKDCNNGSQYPVFDKFLYPGNPLYITRNNVSVAKSLRVGDKNVTQWWYPAEQVGGDKRAEYRSTKYPGIIGVHKFRIPAHWPEEYDMATFRFPTGLPEGNYIAHFKWGGYRDCTDVHIISLPTVTENPWGLIKPAEGPTFARLDHCEYTYVRNPTVNCAKMTGGNASYCLSECAKKSYGSCSAVQAVRKTNLGDTLDYPPNYPTKLYTYNTSGDNVFPPPEFGPCDSRTIKKRLDCPALAPQCPQSLLDTMVDSDYLCYGLVPYRDQDFQTTDDYVISTDPQDPGFYSTCFVRLAPGGFLPSPPPAKPPPVWRVGKKCLSCDWLANTFPTFSVKTAPNWEGSFTTECMDCDLLSATSCKPDTSYVEGGNLGSCAAEVNNTESCTRECDTGFDMFGEPRVCQKGILLGPAQTCTFKGC